MNVKELMSCPWIFEKRHEGYRWKKIIPNSFTYSGVSDAVILYTSDGKGWICYFDPPFQSLNKLLSSPRLIGTDGEVKTQVDQIVNRVANLTAFS
jgi:hypothetical protein